MATSGTSKEQHPNDAEEEVGGEVMFSQLITFSRAGLLDDETKLSSWHESHILL